MQRFKNSTYLKALALAAFCAGPMFAGEPVAGTLTSHEVPCDDPATQCANTWEATVSCSPCACTGEECTSPPVEVSGTGSTQGEAEANALKNCKELVDTGSTTGSDIDNNTFNHRHYALDFRFADTGNLGAKCGSCVGLPSPKIATYARLSVNRVQSLRDLTVPASFGRGVFLGYDVNLTLFEVNGVTYIDCFNPSWRGVRRYSPSGTEFRDTIYDSVKAVRLLDAAGRPTTVRTNAVKAVYVSRNGVEMLFDLFDLDANRKGGRLAGTRLLDGTPVLSFTYANDVADASVAPEAKWRKSGASDLYGNTLSFNWGEVGITSIVASGGSQINYVYDAAGNLSSVTLPNGDVSTSTRAVEGNLLKVSFHEVGATGMHRNKSAYYSNNIAASVLGWSNDSRPVVYNQASQLVRKITNGEGELVYWAAVGGNGSGSSAHRKVYEGGGRMRFIDVSEKSAYRAWSAPNGISSSNAFGSIASTKEKNGHYSPYWEYAQNRSARPNSVVTPESPVHYYLYDANGNLRLERIGTNVRRVAYDARFNKPVMSVDFSGKASLLAYDAAGNIVSRKTGWAYDAALPVGTPLAGLKCSYYENVALLDDMNAATPVSVQQADSVALGQRQTANTNWGMKFEGKLVLATSATRTFHLSADDAARLVIDGVNVLQATYSQGTRSVAVNLTAGVHDFRVDFRENGGAQRLDLTWSGPETTDAAGNVATTIIGSNFLAHESVADELTLRATPAAAEETWTYYPTGHVFSGLQQVYVDAAGKRTEFEYDANRRLVALKETGDTGALVTVQTRTYDAAGNVATITDAVGRVIRNTYDVRNRLIKTTYGDTTTETVTYGTGVDAGLVVAEKDRAGSVTKHEYDTAGRRVKTLRGYALADNDGNITKLLDAPSVETLVYLDGTTDPIRTVRDGKVTEYDYDYKGRVVATRSFPASGKVLATSVKYDADEVSFSKTDAHGCRSFYAYRRPDMQLVREVRELVPGALGALADEAAVLAVARATGANPAFAVTDYERDGDGRVTATVDPLGVRTVNTYDAAGRVIATTRAAGTAVAATTTTTYDAAGRVVAQADALGRTTTRTYTPAGRVASVVYPDAKTEEFTYYGDGKLATRKDADGFTAKQKWSVCCGRDFASANPKGEGQLKFYDGPGRVTYAVSVKDVEAAVSFVNFSTGISLPADAVTGAETMKYDARGRLVASTKWLTVPAAVNPHAAPIATDPAQGLTTTYAYYDDLTDARFAPVLAKLAAQGVTLTAGSATVVTNPAGESSFSVQDGAGRTVATGAFNK